MKLVFNLSFYKKVFLLLYLIGSNVMLEVNSSTKLVKNWKRMNKKSNKRKSFKANSYKGNINKGSENGFQNNYGTNNPGYSSKFEYGTSLYQVDPKMSGTNPYSQITNHKDNIPSPESNSQERGNFDTYEDIENFILIKQLYVTNKIVPSQEFRCQRRHFQENNNIVDNENCARLYYSKNFEANNYVFNIDDFRYYIGNPNNLYSIEVPASAKLMITNWNRGSYAIGFSDTSIPSYPFSNQIIYPYYDNVSKEQQIANISELINFQFLIKEEVVIFREKYFIGKNKKLEATYIFGQDTIEKIGSIMITPDYFVKISFYGEITEDLIITKDEPILNIDNPETIRQISFIKKFDLELPAVADDCIIVFYKENFKSDNESNNPDTFCLGEIDTNAENHDQIKQSVNYNDYKKKGNIYDFYLKNVGSVVVGKNVTAVLFDDDNYTGRAYPVKEYITSTKYFLDFKKVQSILILKAGCYILFPKINFEPDSSTNTFKLCYSVNNMFLANEKITNYGSVIVAKNTEITLMSTINFDQGYSLKLRSTTSNMLIYNEIQVASIMVNHPKLPGVWLFPQNQNTEKPSLNLRGCIQLFKSENYQGSSLLVCDEETYFTDGYEFKSFIIFPGDDLVICQTKTYIFLLDFSSCIHAQESLSSYTGINRKFNRLFFIKKNCITLFQKPDYTGRFFVLCNSSYDLSAEEGSLIQYNSIRRGPDAPKIKLYSQIDFKGKELIVEKETFIIFNDIKSIIFGDEYNTEQQIDTGWKDSNLMIGVTLGMFLDHFKKNEKSPRQVIIDCISSFFPESVKSVNRSYLTEKSEISVIEIKDNHSNIFSRFLSKGFYYMKKCLKWYCNFKEKFYGIIQQVASYFQLGVEKKSVPNNSNKITQLLAEKLSTNDGNTLINLANNTYKNKKYRRTLRKKFRRGKGVIGTITYFWDWIKNKISNFFTEYIYGPLVRAKNKIVSYFNFFEKPWFKRAVTIVTCALNGMYSVYEVLNGFYTNVQLIILAISSILTGLGVVIIIDFVLSLLCNYKYFKLAATYFSIGNKYSKHNNESSVAYYYYGLGIGAILRAIATATPITNIIAGVVKSWGSFKLKVIQDRIHNLDFEDIPSAELTALQTKN